MENTPRIRVLLTEDNRADVYLIREAFKEHLLEFELEVVDNGEKATLFMERLANGLAQPPDIVLLDLNLPRYDGKEVLHKLKQIPGGDTIPVVVVTSSDSPRDREEVAQLGASYYFRKSSELSDFMQIGKIVKDLIQAKNTNAPSGKSQSASATSGPPSN